MNSLNNEIGFSINFMYFFSYIFEITIKKSVTEETLVVSFNSMGNESGM